MRLAPLALLAVVTAGLTGLTACGSEPDRFESYCGVVTAEAPGLAKALDAGSAGLLPGLPAFERLEKAAPDDIADDWGVIVQRLRALSGALDAAGVDPASYDAAKPPEGISDAQQEAIGVAAAQVATEAVQAALSNVQQQSRDVCGEELVKTG